MPARWSSHRATDSRPWSFSLRAATEDLAERITTPNRSHCPPARGTYALAYPSNPDYCSNARQSSSPPNIRTYTCEELDSMALDPDAGSASRGLLNRLRSGCGNTLMSTPRPEVDLPQRGGCRLQIAQLPLVIVLQSLPALGRRLHMTAEPPPILGVDRHDVCGVRVGDTRSVADDQEILVVEPAGPRTQIVGASQDYR